MNALRVFALANPRKLGGLFPTLKLEDALPDDPAVRDAALLQVLERLSLPALDFRQQRGQPARTSAMRWMPCCLRRCPPG